jgi:prepilin-type N-terminal cleavage/methylation domain-containing protein
VYSARKKREQGFTLVELMIVLAMIAILTAVAISYQGENRASIKGFAAQIAGEADAARLRATSTRKWQRITFDPDVHKVHLEQAVDTGMEMPADDGWIETGRLDLPQIVHVAAITTTADIDSGNAVTDGNGLDEALLFAPDGSSRARTVYLSTIGATVEIRIVVYRATGTAYVKDGW